MVPNGWNTKPLADIVKEKISYGIVQAGPHVPDGIPYIKSSDVRGTINPDALQRTSQEIHFKYRRSSVHPGDIVFSLRGNIGESAIVPASLPEANLTQGTARISVSVEHSNLFHYYQLASEKILNRVNALSKGSTFKEISLEELRKVKVLCAPLPEQKKIAQILSTWDKAITTTEQLLANSQQQKKALMQQLLTGKKRLLDDNGQKFSGEWEEIKLKELFCFKRGKGLSKSAINKDGHNKCILYGELFTHYPEVVSKVLSKTDEGDSISSVEGDILIPSSTTTSGIDLANATALLESNVLLGGDINILRPKESLSSEFFAYLLTHIEKRQIASFAQGITIIHIYGSDLKKVKVKVSVNVREQQKIAAVLTSADQEIDSLQQKIEALKQEKKALMQQLLTGKRRVKP